VSTIRSRRAATAVLLLALAACGRPDPVIPPAEAADPTAQSAAAPQTGRPGDRLIGRWQVPQPALPPTTIELARDGAATRARVWLSGVTYAGAAVGDDTSVVVYRGDRAAIRGVLQPGGDRLRIEFLGEGGAASFTQVLVRLP
jgi:predicted small lipoprotein YifL